MILEFLNIDVNIVVYNGNRSAMKLSKNHMFHARTNHTNVRHHFIREIGKSGVIVIKFRCNGDILALCINKASMH